MEGERVEGGEKRRGARRGRALALPAVAATSLIFTLAAVEITLRAFDLPHPDSSFQFLGPELATNSTFQVDDELFWLLNPRTPELTVNRLGLRGWLPESPKGERDLRLACVGDSCTFGLALRYEEAYCVRLERLLQERWPEARVESIVAAIPGYSTHQSRILYDKHIAPLHPDVTILYLGAWNDLVAAVGEADSQKSERLKRYERMASLRIARLVDRALAPGAAYTEEELRRLMREGRPPYGRRVPPAEFLDNVRFLIRRAHEIGSLTVVVVPPLPPTTTRNFPIALEYRALTVQAAAESGAVLLDAPKLFDAQDESSDGRDERKLSPLFLDWVHPSALGNEVLARELLALVEAHLPPSVARRLGAPSPAHPVRIASVRPPVLPPLHERRLSIEGVGFASGGVDRVWVGERWIPDMRVVDDTTIRLTLPATLAPGRYAVQAVTPFGIVESPEPLVVQSVEIATSVERRADGLRVEFSGSGPPGYHVAVWLSNAERAVPARTSFGPFFLASGEGAERPEDSLAELLRKPLPMLPGRVAADGTWRIETTLPPQVAATVDVFFAQALIASNVSPHLGVLSKSITVHASGDDPGGLGSAEGGR